MSADDAALVGAPAERTLVSTRSTPPLPPPPRPGQPGWDTPERDDPEEPEQEKPPVPPWRNAMVELYDQDLADLYADAVRALPETIDGQPPLPVPAECPVTLDEMLAEDPA